MRRSHDQLPRLKIRRNARDGAISALQQITHTHTESSLGCSEQVRVKRRKKVASSAVDHPLAVLGVPKPKLRSEVQSKYKIYSRFPDVRKLPPHNVLKHIERQQSLLNAEEQAAAVAAWEDDKSSDDRSWFERTFA